MPSVAHVECNLTCPRCFEFIVDFAAFLWGFCPAGGPVDAYGYNVGDAIRWGTLEDGSIPAWAFLETEPFEHAANCGDPAYLDVIIVSPYGHQRGWECTTCGLPFSHTVVGIRGGRVAGARIVTLAEYAPGPSDCVLDNGVLIPMPEWEFHPMQRLKGLPPKLD